MNLDQGVLFEIDVSYTEVTYSIKKSKNFYIF